MRENGGIGEGFWRMKEKVGVEEEVGGVWRWGFCGFGGHCDEA